MYQDSKVVLRQPIITSYVCVNQACSLRTCIKSFDDLSSSNIVAYSLYAGDDMIWQPESMWGALPN
eukprot:1143925-Pelagomonas_calceolata.AAC.1